VRHGNGFFGAGSQTTANFVDQVRLVHEEVARQERDPATFQIAKRVYIGVGDKSVKGRVADALGRLYRTAGLDIAEVAVSGSADECAAGLRAVAEGGAELILLNTLFDESDQMHRLANEVLPQLKDL
jgi:alkanesulfonate monooxygenase SsuD/methylene tetrahydromethanopterin reductase-like flavin-dependent oxidoreductase (luciferase family)